MPFGVGPPNAHSSRGTGGLDPFFAVFPQFAVNQSAFTGYEPTPPRAQRPKSPVNGRPHRPGQGAAIPPGGENVRVDLGRIAWMATVFACLIAVVILLLQGYYGYAGVTFAVAVSAGINLT